MQKNIYCINSNKKYMDICRTMIRDFNLIMVTSVDIDNIKKEIKLSKSNKLYNDYIRLYYIYNNGGLLLDGKIEIYKNINNFFAHDMFLGFYDDKSISTNILWCKEPNNEYVKQLLDKIEENKYDNITDVFNDVFGQDFNDNYNTLVNINNEVFIYPYDFFYPLDYTNCGKDISENLKMITYENKKLSHKPKRKLRFLKFFGLSGYRYIVTRLRTIKNKIGWKKYLLEEKLKDKLIKSKSYKEQINNALQCLDKYESADYIIIHNPRWLGVTSATKELFENLLPLQEVYGASDVKKVAKKIVDLNIKQVVFSAFCFGWENIAIEIRKLNKNIKIKVFWHGSNSQVIEDINWKTNVAALNLQKAGVIDVFATCKKSIINFYKSQGYKTAFITNTVRLPQKVKEDIKNKKYEKNDSNIKIGLYAAGLGWRKNMYNQLAAISLIPNSIADLIPLSYEAKVFAKKSNAKITGINNSIKREELLKRISENDINLYVTFSECSPMLPIESMELGVICLLGNNNHYFKDTQLEKYLVVDREDDVINIADKIKFALENKEKIMELYKQWKIKNDEQSRQSVQDFLNM